MPENTSRGAFRFTNKVLQSLGPDVVGRLKLRPVVLPAERELETPGSPIEHLFFLEAGVALMTTTFEDGSEVEVGLFGPETVLGVSGLMGTRRSLNRVFMQFGGHGYASSLAAAKAEFLHCGTFLHLSLSSVQAQLSQVAQSAGCNAKHDVEQRLARWMLLCVDRTADPSFPVSQEALANMLGVRRMSAGVVIGHFKELGLLEHHRGQIVVRDVRGLEAKACECYRVVKKHLATPAEFDTGFIQAI